LRFCCGEIARIETREGIEQPEAPAGGSCGPCEDCRGVALVDADLGDVARDVLLENARDIEDQHVKPRQVAAVVGRRSVHEVVEHPLKLRKPVKVEMRIGTVCEIELRIAPIERCPEGADQRLGKLARQEPLKSSLAPLVRVRRIELRSRVLHRPPSTPGARHATCPRRRILRQREAKR
jgi:hypothetical protein